MFMNIIILFYILPYLYHTQEIDFFPGWCLCNVCGLGKITTALKVVGYMEIARKLNLSLT